MKLRKHRDQNHLHQHVACLCGITLNRCCPGVRTTHALDICIHNQTSSELFEFLVKEAAEWIAPPSVQHLTRMTYAWKHLAQVWNMSVDEVFRKWEQEVYARTNLPGMLPGILPR